jgi:hypothetical protein
MKQLKKKKIKQEVFLKMEALDNWRKQVLSACQRGDLYMLQRLITKENATQTLVELPDNEPIFNDVLTYCCQISQFKCVQWLVETLGVPISDTAMFASCYSSSEEYLTYLLKHGGNPNAKHSNLGYSLLHKAVLQSVRIVKQLLNDKADIHYQSTALVFGDAFGDAPITPLELLLCYIGMQRRQCHMFISQAELLIDAGARLEDVKNVRLITPTIQEYANKNKQKWYNCSSTTMVLCYCFRRRGAPHDMTRYVLQRYVLSTWANPIWLP